MALEPKLVTEKPAFTQCNAYHENFGIKKIMAQICQLEQIGVRKTNICKLCNSKVCEECAKFAAAKFALQILQTLQCVLLFWKKILLFLHANFAVRCMQSLKFAGCANFAKKNVFLQNFRMQQKQSRRPGQKSDNKKNLQDS